MTRVAIFITAAIFLCGCGQNVPLPPRKFDHAPTRAYQDIRLPYWQIDKACRAYGDFPAGRIEGCVVSGRVPLRIVPSDNVDAARLAAIIRHENGHLNGWPSDHPGARYE